MRTADDGMDHKVTPVSNLTEFFRDALGKALASQRIFAGRPYCPLCGQPPDPLFPHRGIAWRYAARPALGESGGPAGPGKLGRVCSRTRGAAAALGDVSLFVAGFFAHGFERRLVDVDYHIAKGGRAYGTLAATPISGPRRALCGVFRELAGKFQPVVDAIGEISDTARVWSQTDVLRLYELWLKTGSRRAQGLLQQLGVAAAPVSLRPN